MSGTRVMPIAAAPPPSNQAADAVDDAASTASHRSITAAVLANDTDPNLAHDSLPVTSGAQGANGTAAINEDGTIAFPPAPTFRGVATFQYAIADAAALTDAATVTVTVAPPPPRTAPRLPPIIVR